jgi:ABC-type multidrug transport system ATPase subunit
VNLRVETGTVFALLGPNGSGKTTLLKIISTLLMPDAGTLRVLGHVLPGQEERVKTRISFAMGDERSFYWRLTARQNLMFFAALYDLSPRQSEQKIAELGDVFSLKDYLDRPYEELSSGIRQRLAIARSFLNDAALLLADEPTRSLDAAARNALHGLLQKLVREHGKTILFTTHNFEEARRVADTVGILNQGRLCYSGKWKDGLESYLNAPAS